MKMIEWTDDLSVGVYVIDADHRFLIKLIQQFNAAVEAKEKPKKIQRLMDGFYEYTDFHFLREEILMRACGYEDFEAHHGVHVTISAQMKEICDNYKAHPTRALSKETLEFLNVWLTNHIMKTDMAYAESMKGKELEIAEAHSSMLQHHSETESAEASDVY